MDKYINQYTFSYTKIHIVNTIGSDNHMNKPILITPLPDVTQEDRNIASLTIIDSAKQIALKSNGFQKEPTPDIVASMKSLYSKAIRFGVDIFTGQDTAQYPSLFVELEHYAQACGAYVSRDTHIQRILATSQQRMSQLYGR